MTSSKRSLRDSTSKYHHLEGLRCSPVNFGGTQTFIRFLILLREKREGSPMCGEGRVDVSDHLSYLRPYDMGILDCHFADKGQRPLSLHLKVTHQVTELIWGY